MGRSGRVGGRAARLALAALPFAPLGRASAQSWFEGDHALGEWGGARATLAEQGLAIDGSWTGEAARVFGGGAHERSSFRNLLDLNATLDLEPLLSLPGATLYADYYVLNGRPLFDDVGDFQWCSNIDSEPMHQLAELWWEQRLVDGALRWKIGKVDANTEFGYAENTLEFVHSGLAWPVTSAMPLYPDPATSVNLFLTPIENCTLALGCYDGAGQEGFSTGGRGTSTFLGDPAATFWIGQLDLRWSLAEGALPGRVGLGATLHTGTFDRFDGARQHGAKSFYATLDQALWREHPDDAEDLQGLAFGAIAGRADDDVSEAAAQLSAGVVWTGFLPGRDDDVVGLGASWLRFAPDAGFGDDHELALELLWKVQVTPWLVVRPDLQLVLDPGGDPSLDDAWVGLLRIEVTL